MESGDPATFKPLPDSEAALSDSEAPPAPAPAAAAPSVSPVRHAACAVVFIVFVWTLMLAPEPIKAVLPQLWQVPAADAVSVTLYRPADVLQAFDLGVASQQYGALGCEGSPPSDACAAVLAAAGKAVGSAGPLSHAQMVAARAVVTAVANERSLGDRIAGFFSLINILVTVGVIGVACTLLPCLYMVFGDFFKLAAEKVFEYVIQPAHKHGVLEALLYVLIALLATQASRYPAGGLVTTGASLGLLSGLGFAPAWIYSTTLHAREEGKPEHFVVLSSALLCLVLVPLAIAHASTLIGFFAVLALYGGLGFFFASFLPGCFVIGFIDRSATLQCLKASAALVGVFTAARVSGLGLASYVAPFAEGAVVLGNVVGCLALLILSTRVGWGWRKHVEWSAELAAYLLWNALLLLVMLASLVVGTVYAITPARNTALTFLVLWAMTKPMEFDWGEWWIVIAFLGCAALVYLGVLLSHHTSFLVAVFSPDGLYVL